MLDFCNLISEFTSRATIASCSELLNFATVQVR